MLSNYFLNRAELKRPLEPQPFKTNLSVCKASHTVFHHVKYARWFTYLPVTTTVKQQVTFTEYLLLILLDALDL